MKKIMWRCDDFGSATGANEGILRLARLGLPINVSVMICGPATRSGIDELAACGPHVCLGVHSAITSEWEELKWGPVGKATLSTGLVNAKGHFYPDYEHAQKEAPETIAAEVEAQILRAREWNVPFTYLDEHMCYAWLDGVAPLLAKLAAKYGLVYDRDLGWLPDVPENGSSLVDRIGRQIDAVKSEKPHLAVFHPAVDDASTRQFWLKGGSPGPIAEERQRELEAFASDTWRKMVSGGEVELMTYRDL